jgi:hypothetical protein
MGTSGSSLRSKAAGACSYTSTPPYVIRIKIWTDIQSVVRILKISIIWDTKTGTTLLKRFPVVNKKAATDIK